MLPQVLTIFQHDPTPYAAYKNNADGKTILFACCARMNADAQYFRLLRPELPKLASVLVAAGCDAAAVVDASSCESKFQTPLLTTALLEVCRAMCVTGLTTSDRSSLVAVALNLVGCSGGANPAFNEGTEGGNSAIHLACKARCPEVLQAIIDRGGVADGHLFQQNQAGGFKNSGSTPLMLACEFGSAECATILIQSAHGNKSLLTLRNGDSMLTAMQLARRSANPSMASVVQLLMTCCGDSQPETAIVTQREIDHERTSWMADQLTTIELNTSTTPTDLLEQFSFGGEIPIVHYHLLSDGSTQVMNDMIVHRLPWIQTFTTEDGGGGKANSLLIRAMEAGLDDLVAAMLRHIMPKDRTKKSRDFLRACLQPMHLDVDFSAATRLSKATQALLFNLCAVDRSNDHAGFIRSRDKFMSEVWWLSDPRVVPQQKTADGVPRISILISAHGADLASAVNNTPGKGIVPFEFLGFGGEEKNEGRLAVIFKGPGVCDMPSLGDDNGRDEHDWSRVIWARTWKHDPDSHQTMKELQPDLHKMYNTPGKHAAHLQQSGYEMPDKPRVDGGVVPIYDRWYAMDTKRKNFAQGVVQVVQSFNNPRCDNFVGESLFTAATLADVAPVTDLIHEWYNNPNNPTAPKLINGQIYEGLCLSDILHLCQMLGYRDVNVFDSGCRDLVADPRLGDTERREVHSAIKEGTTTGRRKRKTDKAREEEKAAPIPSAYSKRSKRGSSSDDMDQSSSSAHILSTPPPRPPLSGGGIRRRRNERVATRRRQRRRGSSSSGGGGTARRRGMQRRSTARKR